MRKNPSLLESFGLPNIPLIDKEFDLLQLQNDLATEIAEARNDPSYRQVSYWQDQ
ncbi:MAG: hypothetical protein ACOYK8_03050 [Alphaproteobacteria bacterium]